MGKRQITNPKLRESHMMKTKTSKLRIMGWFNNKLQKAWRFIFSLIEVCIREGGLPLSDLAWKEVRHSWWQFLTDVPLPEEERWLVWEYLPQILTMPMLCKVNPIVCLSERRIMERQPISTFLMGSKHTTKLIQVFQPNVVFNLHVFSQETEMEVLQHNLTMYPEEGQTKEKLRQIGWNLRDEAKSLLPFHECPTPNHIFLMNIRSHNRELICNCNPAIFVVMETRIRGDRAREIIDRLPFHGAIHTNTIGYVGGLWVLWNADKVDVTPLANTEQGIHIVIKVQSSNSSCLFSDIYVSPRSVERHILRNNLMGVSEIHNMPCVLAGDFNKPLMEDDKFRGRAMNVNRSIMFKECLNKCCMIDIRFFGSHFTWTNRREIQTLIPERIDRFFGIPTGV